MPRVEPGVQAAADARTAAKSAEDAAKPGALNLTIDGDFDDQVIVEIDGVETAKSHGKTIAIEHVGIGQRKLTARAKKGAKELEAASMVEVKPGVQNFQVVLPLILLPKKPDCLAKGAAKPAPVRKIRRHGTIDRPGRVAFGTAFRTPCAKTSSTVEASPELVEHHYTEAGLSDPAVTYWHRAGEKGWSARPTKRRSVT